MHKFLPLLVYISYFIFCLGLLHIILLLIQTIIAFFCFKQNTNHSDVIEYFMDENPEFLISISVIVPAFNEEVTLTNNIHNLLALNYPSFDIIVVNDGSRDHTIDMLINTFNLLPTPYFFEQVIPHQPIKTIYRSQTHSNLWVVDKQNGGKADAINAGITVSRADLFCVIDADSILDKDALKRILRPFIEHPDDAVAAGGVISGINNLDMQSGRVTDSSLSSSILHNIQTLEYYRSFLIARTFWDFIDGNFIISGAFGVFKKSAVIKVGGYSINTVGEDLEIIFKLHKLTKHTQKKTLFFIPDPVCWTETPDTLAGLSTQRKRWQRGMLETLIKHRNLLFDPKDFLFSWIVLPYLWLTEMIFVPATLLGYILVIGLYINGSISPEFFLAFFTLEFLLGLLVSLVAIVIKQWQEQILIGVLDILIFFFSAIIEVFGFRQLNSAWRVMGYWQFLKKKEGWGTISRRGM